MVISWNMVLLNDHVTAVQLSKTFPVTLIFLWLTTTLQYPRWLPLFRRNVLLPFSGQECHIYSEHGEDTFLRNAGTRKSTRCCRPEDHKPYYHICRNLTSCKEIQSLIDSTYVNVCNKISILGPILSHFKQFAHSPNLLI